jgi:hypothetical protein
MQKFYAFFQGFSQGASSPGLARLRAFFLIVWKVFARLQARKNLPHDHMSAPQARKKQ